jgi:hypothetical protein
VEAARGKAKVTKIAKEVALAVLAQGIRLQCLRSCPVGNVKCVSEMLKNQSSKVVSNVFWEFSIGA